LPEALLRSGNHLDKIGEIGLKPALAEKRWLATLMLSTCGAKGSVMTAKQTPRCASVYVKDQAIDAVHA